MSNQKQDFIEKKLSEKKERDAVQKKRKKLEKAREKVKRPPYKNPFYWSLALFLLPIGVLGIIAYMSGKVMSTFGDGEMAWLYEIFSENPELAETYGVNWIPDFNIVYENRVEITTALFIIVGIIVLIAFVIEYRNVTKAQKLIENAQEENDDNNE